eukprot:INCI4193.2.p2 GENE.INCI4193.2~~INCI4193.2.p2  ORF type:complete len:156 (+),score=34.97 INCI4193.2:292-759(+)
MNTPSTPAAGEVRGGGGKAAGARTQTSGEILTALSRLEQRVIKFVDNSQRTMEILATLPSNTSSDSDTAEKLEQIVAEQLEILEALQTQLPQRVHILGNYRASHIDAYESDLQCADTQQRLRVIQGQLLETANFVNSISAANEANPAASALSTSQ